MHTKPKLAQHLIDKYGLRDHGYTTADKIKQPPPKPRDVALPADGRALPLPPQEPPPAPAEKQRWAPIKRHAFDLLAPHALYVAATDGPVTINILNADGTTRKSFGRNRGCWPVRIGTTASHRDTVTPLIDKDPFFAITVKRRLWLPLATEASTLALHVTELLAKAAEEAGFEQLLHGYTDAGPDFSPEGFERHILLVAKRMDVIVWTEENLSRFLDKAIEHARTKGIDITDARGRRINHPAFVKLIDRMVEQEREKQFVGRRQ